MRASEFMTSDIVTVSADDSLESVASLLVGRHIRAVPVVDDGRRLVGMVSQSDVLRSESPSGSGSPPRVVAEAMTDAVVTVPPTADVCDVSRLMLQHDLRTVPVVTDGLLVGVVTRDDVLRVVAHGDHPAGTGGRGDAATGNGGDHGWPVDHGGLQVLGLAECLARVRSVPIGRVGFLSEGEPLILPVNHGLDHDNVVFRTAPGSKLFAAERNSAVTFEVDDYAADLHTGWSVLISGVMERVYDDEVIARLNAVGPKPWADAVDRTVWVMIRSEDVSGRAIAR